MKKCQSSLGLILLVLAMPSFSQTTELKGTVKLRPLSKVYKLVTIPNCPVTVPFPPGTTLTTVKHETKYTNDKTEITVESNINPANAPLNINANQSKRIPIFPNSDGDANLYLDDKDKSVLYVNYWLNGSVMVPGGTVVEEYFPAYNCLNLIPTDTRRLVRTLPASGAIISGQRVTPGGPEMTTQWFINAEKIYVLNAAGTLDYYIVDRYQRNGKYVLELKNREYISYASPSLDLAALTIPFKYRFGFSKGNIDVKDDVTAGVNIGLYGGFKLSRYKIVNRAGTYVNSSDFSVRLGPFISLSSVTLDSVSTTLGKLPMKKDDKQNIAVLSTGAGLMFDVRGVQFGVYAGWDFGMGADAGNWNYHKRFWLGFGVGYKLTDLLAKKE